MRMRRKKNLEEKLMGVNDVLLIPACSQKDTRAAVQQKEFLNLSKLFGNNHPVHLEIGCGKGRFAVIFAMRHPEINLIALEKSANVVYEGCVHAQQQAMTNLKFINMDAKLLTKYFAPSSIARIYLNFSCPYPKNTYQSRRLTHPCFLSLYKDILAPGGTLFQKTDNVAFFEYSLNSLISNWFTIELSTRDLHRCSVQENIETEYERKFVSQGCKICALTACLQSR